MKVNTIGYAFIILLLYICIKTYKESDAFNLKCIISTVDGKKYCVRERNKLTLAADRLARVNQKMEKLVNYCKEKYPERKNVKKLVEGYNPKHINNGYNCSICDPFLFLVAEIFKVNITHKYLNTIVHYCHIKKPERTLYFTSNTGHFQASGKL